MNTTPHVVDRKDSKGAIINLSESVIGFSLAFLAAGCGDASKLTSLPNKFEMDENVMAIGTDMKVFTDEGSLGKIEERTLRLGTTFEYFDSGGEKQATAKKEAISWGVQIDIFDGEGTKLGAVHEKVFESMFSIKSQYEVFGPNGETIASSEKLDLVGTDITIKDPSGDVVATLERPWMNFGGDRWRVDITGDIDPRLIIFIPSYKTSADNARKAKK